MLAAGVHGEDMNIQGQGALITGASRGLGRALAEALALRGARVAMVAREGGPLHDAVATIRARGGVAHAIVGDIGAKDAIHRIAGQAQGLLGEISIAIHNASTLGPTPLRLLLDTECEDLATVLETNLVGPFRLTRILAGAMALRGAGVIVHISSDAAIEPYPRWGAYGASKAAQDHLSRILAAELADTGVRILAVDPGEMDTAMHAPGESHFELLQAFARRGVLEHALELATTSGLSSHELGDACLILRS
ncbi:MAG: Oxidoreductase, short chain dehydrogenase/reductase family protein [Myxococcales bacterium]|nr:Oxidoreductase, short chain dehydrogenase/reductase family protein [Myxococcales bacterium]